MTIFLDCDQEGENGMKQASATSRSSARCGWPGQVACSQENLEVDNRNPSRLMSGQKSGRT